MNDELLPALRAVADAAYGYLSAARAERATWRADLTEALAQLIMALEEPIPADDEEPELRPLRLLPAPEQPGATVVPFRRSRRQPEPPDGGTTPRGGRS